MAERSVEYPDDARPAQDGRRVCSLRGPVTMCGDFNTRFRRRGELGEKSLPARAHEDQAVLGCRGEQAQVARP